MDKFFAKWDGEIERTDTDKQWLYEQMHSKLANCGSNTKIKSNNSKTNLNTTTTTATATASNVTENVEVLWRLVQACIVLADTFEADGLKTKAKTYTEKSMQYAKQAIELDAKSFQAQKWYCASAGRLSAYVGAKEKIQLGYELKEHYDIGVRINANDRLMHHIYGRWCYEVASLTYVERKIASTFFATPPEATFDEAIDAFRKADKLHHAWKPNQMWMAKAYIAIGDRAEAAKWLKTARALPIQSEDDRVAQIEIESLCAKHC